MPCVLLAQTESLPDLMPSSGLLFGLMLAAAIGGGYVAHALRVPRVVGYLLAGAFLKLLLHWLLEVEPDSAGERGLEAAAAPLKAVKDLGLGIILFSIGGVFETRHLKAVGKKVLKIAAGESGLTFVLVFAGSTAAGLIVGDGAATTSVLAFALLLAFASVATAPAATLFVLREYDAKGPATDTILSITGVNNVVCIITFHACFLLLAAAGVLGQVALSRGGVWLDLATTTLGSVALGVVLGFILSVVHAKLQLGETLLILVATLVVTGAGEGWLLRHHDLAYNFLLTALCMGATFANIAIDPDRLEESLRAAAQPILVGFFVIAGYQLHVANLLELSWIGGVYVVCRSAGKVLGAYLGMRWCGASADVRPHLGAALLCQAAVVIGLADFVRAYWQDPWAGRFVTVILGSVVIFEICGPLLTKWVAVRAGEVKAVTLLRRASSTSAGGVSTAALTFAALLRTLGLGRTARRAGDRPLKARHIMRANVKCIPATADLDEVLHFVERSRFNHFPVVDENNGLAGVINYSDIREIIYNPFLSRLMTALDLANPNPQTVPADMPVEEVFKVFQDGDASSLPVVEGPGSRGVIGIIEQRDLLRALHLSRSRS
ncbi:MAG: CBS domain-containing protein [Phycisphaerae bacterium]|nr:CBS domain-containing protein [Phycisphaerae bacterium]